MNISRILCLLALIGLTFTASCTTVEQSEPAPQTTSTTTEQTTITRPYSGSVETQTTRTSY